MLNMCGLWRGLGWMLGLILASELQAQCVGVNRYQVITVAYTGDAPGNAVLDKHTGLQWRRCEEGQRWGGGVCIGVGQQFNHEQALLQGASQVMWQLPDVKQIASLAHRDCRFPALYGPLLVAGPLSRSYWSSTPFVSKPFSAWFLDTDTGRVSFTTRDKPAGLRLVRRTIFNL